MDPNRSSTAVSAPAAGWEPPAARMGRAVGAELARRHAARLATATGTVLDLSTRGGFEVLDAACAAWPPGAERPGGRTTSGAGVYDTVLSIAALVRFADAARAVAAIERLLAPGGSFLFVEPIGAVGWSGVLAASAAGAQRRTRGLHCNRDVPLVVRSSGLIIADLERFTMPTRVWGLRRFADGRALRAADLEPV